MLLFTSCLAFAQTSQSNAQHLKVYRNALKSGDGRLAITSLSYLVADDPKSVYRDSLAIVYLKMQQPAVALYWIQLRLAEKPKNFVALEELQAQAYTAMGDGVNAVAAWESLVKVFPLNVDYQYRLADAQFTIKRQTEALGTIQKIEQLPTDTVKKVAYTVGNSQAVKYTSIAATAANMKGMILYEAKSLPEAKAAFKEALAYDKAYELAANNLAAVEGEEKKTK